MKGKFKFFGIVSIVVFAAIGFYQWGQHTAQTGSGFEIVKQAQAKDSSRVSLSFMATGK
jgi:hypothetical protein